MQAGDQCGIVGHCIADPVVKQFKVLAIKFKSISYYLDTSFLHLQQDNFGSFGNYWHNNSMQRQNLWHLGRITPTLGGKNSAIHSKIIPHSPSLVPAGARDVSLREIPDGPGSAVCGSVSMGGIVPLDHWSGHRCGHTAACSTDPGAPLR